MIKFYYLSKPGEPLEACAMCKEPTTWRLGYEPGAADHNGDPVVLKIPLCDECKRSLGAGFRLIRWLRGSFAKE